MNRLRIRFSRGEEIKYISHLDIIRMWHRAFRRAGIELAYSDGFNPHPRLALASPLPLGVTSEAELMDVYTEKLITPHNFMAAVKACLPPGMAIIQTASVALPLPSMQAQLRHAEFQVRVSLSPDIDLAARIAELLEKESIPWQHQRDTGVKSYDLRPLIEEIRIVNLEDCEAMLEMRLRCDSNGSGRPEQVVKALGLDFPLSIHRTRLLLAGS